MLQIGQPAPDFTLTNQNGEAVTLSSLRGKRVVLFAFPKAFTAGCDAQACTFRDELPQISATNAIVFGVHQCDRLWCQRGFAGDPQKVETVQEAEL